MTAPLDNVFLLDVDDTLLDNDAFEADLGAELERVIGARGRDRYWRAFEALRGELDYADYLGALQGLRHDPVDTIQLPRVSDFMLQYPFSKNVYPGSLDAVRHLAEAGPTVLVSDGDVVFQPHKIRRAGLWDAVEGRVLIYIHKERMLDDIQRRYPARHFTMVDDKPRVLAAMKDQLRARLTAVFIRQGHYARDHAADTRPDIVFDHIGDLAQHDFVEAHS